MAWGFARLGHRTERTDALLGGVAGELARRTWHFKPQDVGATLWSLATIEFFDRDAFRAGASRLNFRHIRSFKVRSFACDDEAPYDIDGGENCDCDPLNSFSMTYALSRADCTRNEAARNVKYGLGPRNGRIRPGAHSRL